MKPELRGKGIGKTLLAELAKIAVENDYYGVKWEVLDWNQPAIDFYESLGAQVRRAWLPVRITGEPLHKLAAQSPKAAGSTSAGSHNSRTDSA